MLAAAVVIVYAPERERICVRGYAAQHRLHGEEYRRMRDAAFARAGIPTSLQCTLAEYESDEYVRCWSLDHIVPLELGGSNEPDNLQVQPKDEARAKDKVEDEIRRRYCAGEIADLKTAQGYFSRSRR